MRVISLAVLFCGLCQGAVAQTSTCSTVPKASDRLACYDRAVPPIAKSGTLKNSPSPVKSSASEAPNKQMNTVDLLAVENSKLDAKIKTICRGC
jgi:hypothetical protein